MHLGRNWRALCGPYQFMGALLLCKSSRWLPRLILLMSSGSKKKESRYACLSEAKASHSQRMWAEISSSAPHLLHNGLSDRPIRWRCLLRILCPVRRPVITLDFVLLKDRNLTLAPSQGPEINSRACLWVLPRPRHHTQCWLTNQRLILLISCLETPKAGSGPTNFRIPAHYLTAWLPYLLARVWRISIISLSGLWQVCGLKQAAGENNIFVAMYLLFDGLPQYLDITPWLLSWVILLFF